MGLPDEQALADHYARWEDELSTPAYEPKPAVPDGSISWTTLELVLITVSWVWGFSFLTAMLVMFI